MRATNTRTGWQYAVIGIVALAATACSSGGDGDSGTPPTAQSTVVTGTVLAPNGQLAKAPTPGPFRWFAALLEISVSFAQPVTGWSAVPNTLVRVLRIDDAGNLVGDMHVYNRQTQSKNLVSVGPDANGNPVVAASSSPFDVDSANPSASADGSSVAFDSNANDWVMTGVSNPVNSRNVFVRTLATNQTRQSSVGPCGIGSNGLAKLPTVTGDGSLLVFAADASNLAQGNGRRYNDDTNLRWGLLRAR